MNQGDVIINSDYQPNQLLFLLIETEKHLASSEELHCANQTSKGLTAESINLNLDNIIKSYDQTDIYINSKIVDQRQVYDNILHWLENPNIFNQYASVVKIENTTGQKHAILLHAKKENNKILLTLIDPLSEEDSIFKDELKKLAYSLQQNRIDVEIIYSGKQDKDYGTCADICLIMLQEFIEQTIIYKKNDR